MDIVPKSVRSRIMSSIKGSNTNPEVEVRKWLHSKGLRFRLHMKTLPGKPDIVMPRWRIVILVNGCFFHNHENCKQAYIPKTRTDWWVAKFEKNKIRDRMVSEELEKKGWKVIVVWECEVKDGSYKNRLETIFRMDALNSKNI